MNMIKHARKYFFFPILLSNFWHEILSNQLFLLNPIRATVCVKQMWLQQPCFTSPWKQAFSNTDGTSHDKKRKQIRRVLWILVIRSTLKRTQLYLVFLEQKQTTLRCFLISLISPNQLHWRPCGNCLNEHVQEATRPVKWLLIEKTQRCICIDYLHLFDQAGCVLVNCVHKQAPSTVRGVGESLDGSQIQPKYVEQHKQQPHASTVKPTSLIPADKQFVHIKDPQGPNRRAVGFDSFQLTWLKPEAFPCLRLLIIYRPSLLK